MCRDADTLQRHQADIWVFNVLGDQGGEEHHGPALPEGAIALYLVHWQIDSENKNNFCKKKPFHQFSLTYVWVF